jgi:hypothetical protein
MPSFYQDRLGTNIGKEHSKKSGVSAGRRLCAHAGCVFPFLCFLFLELCLVLSFLCFYSRNFVSVLSISRGLWLSLSRACLDKSHVVARAVSFPVFSRFLLTYVFIAGTFLHQGQRARAPARRTRSRPCWKITAAAGRSPPHRRRPTPSRRYLHSIIIINVLIYINSINNNAIKK